MRWVLTIYGVAVVAFQTVAAIPGPVDLTVSEGFRDPIGFYDPTPTFSWELPADGKAESQTAYRIVAAGKPDLLPDGPDLWDSGMVRSSQSVWVPYGGAELTSRQRVYWQAKFRDEAGRESAWSETAAFELGLLANSDWGGKWIRMGPVPPPAAETTAETEMPEIVVLKAVSGIKSEPEKQGSTFTPQYFRYEFQVEKAVVQARLYATAKGLYEARLNGAKVGADFMVPGWTPYHKRIETLTYDVTGQLKQGSNALGAILGEGWYAGAMMRKRFVYPQAKPALLLQLDITYADGTTQTVVTGRDWKATNNGPIRSSSIYDGELYDARLDMPGWDAAGYNDASWVGVVIEDIDPDLPLVPKRHYPVRATEDLRATAVTEPEPGRYVFDLGQNMVGWPRLNIPVRRDQPITVRVAEMLQKDGRLYTANYRRAKSTDVYIPAADGSITWHPVFTFHGFRYVELRGLPDGAEPDPDWVTGVVLHSDFPSAGSFTSSHELLNRLQANIRWGQRGNYLDIPTDCPQRDERLGWTGDAQVFCATSIFNYDTHSFWMSWLQSVREEQTKAGLVHHVIPDTGCGAGSPGWGDVAVTSPWNVYVRTGDRRILEENYEMMRKWVGAYEAQAKDFIVDRKGYGDWLVPYGKGTAKDLIATAYFGHCTDLTGKAALVLGRQEDADRYAKQFEAIRNAFSDRFFDGDGRQKTRQPTQTACLMALGYDLLEPGLRAGARAQLLELVNEAGGHLRTGFLGTPLIAFVLDHEGHTDLAYEILFKETYPSWFYSIHQGATTMWERWNSYSHDKGFGNAGMNSFNHYAYGAIGQWMYERIAGLTPDSTNPGYKHFFVRPLPGGPLKHAKAELNTPYGKAAAGWRRINNDGLVIEATVPPNTTATLVIPPGDGVPAVSSNGKPCETGKLDRKVVYDLAPGVHEFVVLYRE